MSRFATLLAIAICSLHTIGCAAPEDVTYGETSSAITVAQSADRSCSTSVVLGLAKQIAREVDCMSAPQVLVRFAPSSAVKFTSNAVLPYMNPGARASLIAAGTGHPVDVNSGYRTVPQQYLVYRWWSEHRCGITAAATPGTSNHESARAVDLANWSTRIGDMAAHGWAHDVPGDPVHFDHLSSPDIRGRDVKAFQRLWNRNHPGDTIATDGVWGAQTAARLRRSPAKGFAKGASCATQRETDVLAVDGPARIAPGAREHYVITLANGGDVDWPADAHLIADVPDLYDAATWASPTDAGEIGVAIPAGLDGELDLDITAPVATAETAESVTFSLVSGASTLAQIDFAVTVSPDNAYTSSEEGDPDAVPDPRADADGVVDESSGCAAGGGGGGWLVLVALVAMTRRRRRRQ